MPTDPCGVGQSKNSICQMEVSQDESNPNWQRSYCFAGLSLVALGCGLSQTPQPIATQAKAADAHNLPHEAKPPPYTTQTVQLIRPADHRQWVFVGAPVTPNDMNDGKAAFPEFHNVYIDPASFASYKKSGTFPDGTMILKELVSVGGKVDG